MCVCVCVCVRACVCVRVCVYIYICHMSCICLCMNADTEDLQRFKFSAVAIPQTVLFCPDKNVFQNPLLNFCDSHRLSFQMRIFIVEIHWLDVLATLES